MTRTRTRRLSNRLAALALAAASALTCGCASTLAQGDRAFEAGNLAQARDAYVRYLTSGRAFGDGESRARYRLGVSFALPETDEYDAEKADRAFAAVIATDPDSLWGRQARLLRSLGQERDRLVAELAAQSERASALLAEVALLEAEVERADDEVEGREQEIQDLGAEIARLKQSLAGLAAELQEREQELEQMKRIDLQTPP
jgi:hypothetical protein